MSLPAVHRHRVEVPGLDGDAAVELFEQLSALNPGSPAALLDSSDHAHTVARERSRASIIALSAGPNALEVRHRAGTTTEHRPGEADSPLRRTGGPFFTWLRETWDHRGAAPAVPHGDLASAHPFQLGWVGWLGYELRREAGSPTHALAPAYPADPPACAADTPIPPSDDDAHLFRATHAVIIDHHQATAEIQTLGDDPAWRKHAQRLLDTLRTGALQAREPVPPSPVDLRELRVRDSREDYLTAINAAQREIRDGNTYEVCLTTAVTASAPAELDALGLFRRVRDSNRAPFTQLLRMGAASRGSRHHGVDVVSTSPERFLSIDVEGIVRSEPIKGTRPRSEDAAEDAALRDDLAEHPKDRAENVMITDLVRNDLSVHADPGTLRTERLCAIESYPSVHQMVSTVSARISSDARRADVVSAAFPPGSMTGAPKISTMDILHRLETGPRGPYSGVAGYFSTTGAADLSVLIRTLVISASDSPSCAAPAPNSAPVRLHLGLGGAIVADSDPAAEWEEVVTKSAGVLGALGVEFPQA